MIAKKNCYIALIFTGSTLLFGCASAPGPVVADVPLVHPNYALKNQGQVVSIAPMKTLSAGETIAISDSSWEIGQQYFSASRQHCFSLRQITASQQHTVNEARLCKSDSSWMFYPSVLANSLTGKSAAR